MVPELVGGDSIRKRTDLEETNCLFGVQPEKLGKHFSSEENGRVCNGVGVFKKNDIWSHFFWIEFLLAVRFKCRNRFGGRINVRINSAVGNDPALARDTQSFDCQNCVGLEKNYSFRTRKHFAAREKRLFNFDT